MPKPRLGLIFFVVLLDIIGFAILLPVLPYFAQHLGATPTQVGILTGLYALCQFVGAPILARLSDSLGRKPMFVLDICGNIIGFVIIGFADALWMFFAARILAGLVSANIPIAQAYIADITSEAERSKALGLLGAAFGCGFTIGPAIGGILLRSGEFALPAFLSAALGVINVCVVIFLLPESLSPERMSLARERSLVPSDMLNVPKLAEMLGSPKVAPMLVVWCGFSLAFALFQQNISLFNKLHLQLSARETSYVFAFIGIAVALTQGVVLRPLTAKFHDEELLRLALPIMACSLGLWAFSQNTIMLLTAIAPLCFSASLLITVVNSLLTKAVSSDQTGGIMGISGAIDNSTRFVAAFAGGAMMERVGTFAPGILALCLMLGIMLWSAFVLKPQHSTTLSK
ncbi:MAG: MFS transporter [Candidatus Kapaibacterium sp.]|nr:MAG: MFS transporter [Candidatus Kapabacteria bacterium]